MIFVLALMLGFLSLSNAQTKVKKEKKTSEVKAQERASYWEKELGLSADEKQKFYDAKLVHINKRKEIMAKYAKDRVAAKPELKESHKVFLESVKAALTPEHFEAWKSKLKASRAAKKASKAVDEENATESGE